MRLICVIKEWNMTPILRRAGQLTTFVLFTLLVWIPAAAQTLPSGADWTHGTTVNLFGGTSTDSSSTGPFLGGGVGWEIKPTLAIEGSMGWIDRPGQDTSAYNAGLKALISFPGESRFAPFLAGGFGLYRASFGAGSEMPEFYSHRVSSENTALNRPNTFTDPAFIFGGGLNIYLNRHLAIRPDVELMIVRADSQSHYVTGVAVRFAYHFEDHPVTPFRR
jgi:Outer membrane protein beta-barrel domain